MFTFLVKIEGIQSKRKSAVLFHILGGFFILAKAVDYYSRSLHFTNIGAILPFLIVGLASLVYGFGRKAIDPAGNWNGRLRALQAVAFAVLGFLMISGSALEYIGLFFFAIVSLLLLASERKIFEQPEIVLNDLGVTIPGTYKNHLVPWNELTDVIVREDFVTFFHVGKKYLQYQVVQDLTTLEIAQMNAFCKERTAKSQVGES